MILTINPGATSTKCALYKIKNSSDIKLFSEKVIDHSDDDIMKFNKVADQIDYREEIVRNFIKTNIGENETITACAGRGGMLTPVPSGAIKVNHELVDFCLNDPVYHHASNLGAPLAFRIAKSYGVDAFIVDPVAVDEFSEVARISGCKDFPRFSFVHALNIRATARKLAEKLNKDFNEIKLVVAHLGGGFSIAVINEGKIVDNDNRMEGAAFTPERAGGIPPIPLVEACFSGNYSKEEILKMLYGQGGVYSYLETKDMREVVSMAEEKNKNAELIYNAMIYQIGKQISAMASVLKFNLDGIILTGGIAHSDKVVNDIKNRVNKLGPIFVYPGSNENEALAATVSRVLDEREEYLTWPVKK